MAKTAPVQQRIDRLLESLTDEWRRLPQVRAEIDGWDLVDQVDFVEEWPLVEQKLAELSGYASDRRLTPEQAARYGELLRLVERNRPIIEHLRQS